MAPGSSGLGNATVGKSGSGSACSATTETLGNPASSSTRRAVPRPTPCMAVSAIEMSWPPPSPARSEAARRT